MCDSTSTGCFFSSSSSSARKENGRSVPDVTASPGRAPPGPLPNQMQNMAQRQGGVKEPVLIQGDFRKVSGISSEIFRQIEAVENDHDPNTAAALDAVERRGEMIVRILEARNIGGKHAVEAAQRLLLKGDARHTVQLVEIVKRPGQTLGLYIREGNGADRADGVFISRIALESAVYNSGCLRVGDEILAVNLVDVTHMSLDDVVIIMSIPRRLVLAIRQRRGSRGANSPGPTHLSRPEQKPPPVVVIKRDLRDEDLDETDRIPRSRSSRERRTGDGREMTESRSRLGLGLNNYSPQSEQLDLYYNSRPNAINEPPSWGYKPPPPPSVITEQPKGHHSFAPSHAYYQNAGTLESLAEKVHSFYPGGPSRRMSAGTGASGVGMSQHARFPRSGSDQHLPRVEYSDYSSSLGRHSLLRSSLKTGAPIATGGGTLGRYGRYEPPRNSKYGTPPTGAGSLTRRSRPNLDYSSDTEATIGQARPSYYYYNRPAIGSMPRGVPTSILGGGPDLAKFNSLPRDRPGVRLGGIRTRLGERLLDDADGNLSAPESSARRERDLLRARITASPSIFTSDEYRAWLRRAPSSSAICDQMRMTRDLLTQPRSHRFSCSAENIHDALRNTESIYSSRTGVMSGGTLDRNLLGIGPRGIASLPVRSMSSQHIGGPSSIRSPSIRRMRQLLELSTGPGSPSGSMISTGHQSPAPTPSATLPRSHRQIDINPAEFAKYKLDKPVMDVGNGVSGMLWIHLLAGRGLRTQPEVTSGNPAAMALQQQQQQQQQQSRDLYCVLECDRVHKARTVVRSGDLQFDWDESFELDLVCNKQLDVLVYSWDPQHRHKLCYRGAISLASLLRQSPLHQLALKVEPRGTIYIRLRHTDPITLYKRRGLPSLRAGYPQLFGADLESVVNRESKGAPGCAPVPVVLRRCVEEVERRGLDIIGLYRLCGSATKKRLLREAFERNSRAVELSPEHVPDINVITGVLKDYLRELPEPLFTRCLFQMTVDALAVCLPDDPEGNAKLMLSILDCLPRANRATLVFLLDHLSLVVSASERNKMSAQALATVMGPPLMLHSSSAIPGSDIDHAQPIAVLKYLLQIWPQPQSTTGTGTVSGRRGEPIGQRGNRVNVLLADKQQLLGSISVGNMALSQDQHRLLATANIHPYQSVVGQLVQSPRVLQQVVLQHPQSVVSVDSVMHAQSPLPGTPSPGSSSASTGSGSGSGTDTVKRGASPASVKHVKIFESSSSNTINTITKPQPINEHQQQQQNDFKNTSSSSSSSTLLYKNKESNNDKSRNNISSSNSIGGNSNSNVYGPTHSSIIQPQFSSTTAVVSAAAPIISKQPSSTNSVQSSTSTKSYSHADDSDSDTGSTRSKTPNPLIEQSQALTTTQLMSKYLKREPLVSMTLISSPSPAIMSSLSSSIRDITTASQTASSRYDNNNHLHHSTGINLNKQQQSQSASSTITSSSVSSEPTSSLYGSNNSRNQVSSSQALGTYHFPSNSIKTSALEDDNSSLPLPSLIKSTGSSNVGSSSSSSSSPLALVCKTELLGKTSVSLEQSSTTNIVQHSGGGGIINNSLSSASSYNNKKVSSPSRQLSNNSGNNSTTVTATPTENNSTLPTTSNVARTILLYQSASADSNNYSLNLSPKNNQKQLHHQQQQQQHLLINDDKQINNISNNFPVSPDPFNTSYINFGNNSSVGSSASLTQSSQGYGGNGNGNGSNNHYNIYGTLPKSTNSVMLSSASSYLSGGGGSSENTTTSSSGVSSMAGSTSSYDFYTNSRQYPGSHSVGSSNNGGVGSVGGVGGPPGGNYHTLGSYRVQYSSTNPFLETFDPPQQHGNTTMSASSQLNAYRDKYGDDLK